MFRMNKNKGSERGIVLVLVLIVVAILSTIVADFTFSTHVDFEISDNTLSDIKARYIAKSGISVVSSTLKTHNLEEISDIGATFIGIQIENADFWRLKVPVFPVGDGRVTIVVEDERSKLNLNSLVNQNSNIIDFQVLTALTELFRYLEVDSSKSDLFVSSLINWLDKEISGSQNDQDPRGANAGFYSGLDNPYLIKDGPLDSVEEIMMIEGMDEEFFNKVKDYLTVYPITKHINFSTAPKAVIIAALKGAEVSSIQNRGNNKAGDLKDDVAETIASEILELRKEDKTITGREARDIVRRVDATLRLTAGLSGMVLNRGTSEIFSVKSTGVVGEFNPTIKEINVVLKKTSTRRNLSVETVSWKEI